jgi:hypothetical protein
MRTHALTNMRLYYAGSTELESRHILRSWVGALLLALYLPVAVFIAQDEVRHHRGDWINLSGMLTAIVTAPSQLLLGPVLKLLGVPKVNYADLGFVGYAQIALHVLVTATIIYFVGASLHLLSVKIVHLVRRNYGS